MLSFLFRYSFLLIAITLLSNVDASLSSLLIIQPGDVADRQTVNCTDVDPIDCPYRASLGECKTNPGYMLTKCGGSCNVDKCCTDKNSYCAYWASVGECTKNPGWMLPNCMASCFPNRCLCTDKVPNCPALAASGECEKNPNYMNFYCKISCQQCEC